ncbi:Brp/Blh family beta-carotene 15,15'-dioxygenase [Sphingomonas rubra]|uniref:Brp/Blh family beta-carotene 15,15'-dioxygenase n=1 Tax=Sphingomonas rubra TaxID=634430 RepID=UPI003CCBB9C5
MGVVHPAGDLAVVEGRRRLLFLIAYGLVSTATLLWWISDPAIELPAFLAASAFHFGIGDAPDGSMGERIARGVALVAAPAALYGQECAALLQTARGSSTD